MNLGYRPTQTEAIEALMRAHDLLQASDYPSDTLATVLERWADALREAPSGKAKITGTPGRRIQAFFGGGDDVKALDSR